MLPKIKGPDFDGAAWTALTNAEQRNLERRQRQKRAGDPSSFESILANARKRPVTTWDRFKAWLYFGKWC